MTALHSDKAYHHLDEAQAKFAEARRRATSKDIAVVESNAAIGALLMALLSEITELRAEVYRQGPKQQ